MRKPRNKKPDSRRDRASAAPAGRPASHLWIHVVTGAVLLLAVFQAYGPALWGEFLFDDAYLPFADPNIGDASLRAWTGTRPLLMMSFWINHRFFGNEPFWLHVFNVVLHFVNALLVYLLARRLLGRVGEDGPKRDLLAAIAGGVFLLHPIQTESVAYIASRSEVLSVMFFYGALAVFLYRREEAISFREAAIVLALFGAAVMTKEHTAVLPVLLVLTDLFAGAGTPLAALRRTWRLYLPISVLAAAGAVSVWQVLRVADSAGFNVQAFTWYQYFFTQCRVIWMYARMVVLPYGQNVDPDIPVSRSLFEHGAFLGLAALVAAVVAAWMVRRRYPLASFGVVTALLLLAPTSSFVPIQDVAAERRVYLPFLGFLLIGLEFLRRARLSRTALAAGGSGLLLVLGLLTWQRSHVWANATALWTDAASKSPGKARPRFQLAFAHYTAGRCAEAVREYSAVAKLQPPDYRLLVDWALAYDCDGRPEEALARLREAIALERNAHAYALIGMVEGKRGNHAEALQALAEALEIDPSSDAALAYRGNVYVAMGELARAEADYRKALSVNPRNQVAAQGLRSIGERRGGKGR